MLASGEAVYLRDVRRNPDFDRSFAYGTGYVPRALLAAPLLNDGDAVGVIEVLDPEVEDSLRAMSVDGMLAQQAAATCAVVRNASWTGGTMLGAGGGEPGPLVALAVAITDLPPERRESGRVLLASVRALLDTST